jgi:hypothetical protein
MMPFSYLKIQHIRTEVGGGVRFVAYFLIAMCLWLLFSPVWAGMDCLTGQLNSPGALTLATTDRTPPPIRRVVVSYRDSLDNPMRPDQFILRAYARSNLVASLNFDAAYGEFSVSGLRLMSDTQTSTIMLITAQGEGTSATRFVLNLYQVMDNKLRRMFHKTISDYFGSGKRWWYCPELRAMQLPSGQKSGEGLSLVLYHDPLGHNKLPEFPDLIPKARSACVFWSGGYFHETDGKTCLEISRK